MFRTLTPTLAILAALIVFFLFIRPQYAELRTVEQDIASYEQATRDYENFKSKIDAFESRRNSVSIVERDRLDVFLPSEIDATQTLVDLESLAKKNFLLFSNIDVVDSLAQDDEEEESDPDMPTTLEYVDVSFDVIGTYEQFKTFLGDLEQNLTLLEVTRISVVVNDGPFLQFAVTVRTYALPAVTSL